MSFTYYSHADPSPICIRVTSVAVLRCTVLCLLTVWTATIYCPPLTCLCLNVYWPPATKSLGAAPFTCAGRSSWAYALPALSLTPRPGDAQTDPASECSETLLVRPREKERERQSARVSCLLAVMCHSSCRRPWGAWLYISQASYSNA